MSITVNVHPIAPRITIGFAGRIEEPHDLRTIIMLFGKKKKAEKADTRAPYTEIMYNDKESERWRKAPKDGGIKESERRLLHDRWVQAARIKIPEGAVIEADVHCTVRDILQ